MLSCLMNEEKLLCLKNLGRMVSENSFYLITMNDSPSVDHPTIESYFLSYYIIIYLILTSTISYVFKRNDGT
jgi:hypothetical protein